MAISQVFWRLFSATVYVLIALTGATGFAILSTKSLMAVAHAAPVFTVIPADNALLGDVDYNNKLNNSKLTRALVVTETLAHKRHDFDSERQLLKDWGVTFGEAKLVRSLVVKNSLGLNVLSIEDFFQIREKFDLKLEDFQKLKLETVILTMSAIEAGQYNPWLRSEEQVRETSIELARKYLIQVSLANDEQDVDLKKILNSTSKMQPTTQVFIALLGLPIAVDQVEQIKKELLRQVLHEWSEAADRFRTGAMSDGEVEYLKINIKKLITIKDFSRFNSNLFRQLTKAVGQFKSRRSTENYEFMLIFADGFAKLLLQVPAAWDLLNKENIKDPAFAKEQLVIAAALLNTIVEEPEQLSTFRFTEENFNTAIKYIAEVMLTHYNTLHNNTSSMRPFAEETKMWAQFSSLIESASSEALFGIANPQTSAKLAANVLIKGLTKSPAIREANEFAPYTKFLNFMYEYADKNLPTDEAAIFSIEAFKALFQRKPITQHEFDAVKAQMIKSLLGHLFDGRELEKLAVANLLKLNLKRMLEDLDFSTSEEDFVLQPGRIKMIGELIAAVSRHDQILASELRNIFVGQMSPLFTWVKENEDLEYVPDLEYIFDQISQLDEANMRLALTKIQFYKPAGDLLFRMGRVPVLEGLDESSRCKVLLMWPRAVKKAQQDRE